MTLEFGKKRLTPWRDKMIELLGPEEAKNLAEELYMGQRLPKKTYDIFSHKVRIHEK